MLMRRVLLRSMSLMPLPNLSLLRPWSRLPCTVKASPLELLNTAKAYFQMLTGVESSAPCKLTNL